MSLPNAVSTFRPRCTSTKVSLVNLQSRQQACLSPHCSRWNPPCRLFCALVLSPSALCPARVSGRWVYGLLSRGTCPMLEVSVVQWHPLHAHKCLKESRFLAGLHTTPRCFEGEIAEMESESAKPASFSSLLWLIGILECTLRNGLPSRLYGGIQHSTGSSITP